jgi:hypothetical protein
MRAEHRLDWTGRGARLVVLFGTLTSAATTSGCVCTPTEDQACEDEAEELYDASGWVTINGVRTAGVWVVSSTGDSARTRLAGDFYFELPLSGATLTARAPAGTAFLEASKSIGVIDRDSIHFEGYRLASISGHVRYLGQPVNAVLSVEGPVTLADTTAADGAYRFDGLPTEPVLGYRLGIVSGPPGIVSGLARRVVLLGRDTVIDLEAAFLNGGYIEGRVSVGANGIGGVIVTAVGPFTVADTTGPDGRYQLPRVPLGPHTVSITAFDPGAYAFAETSRVVTVQPSQNVVDFLATAIVPNRPPVATIAQPADGAMFTAGTAVTFAGSASDPEDGALAGGSLVWTDGAGTALGSGASVTTSTLADGLHRIRLTATDAQGLSGATSILITITPSSLPGSISGRVTANGYGVGDVLVTLSGAASATAVTDGNASYSFQNLLPGTYTVTISGYPSAISFPSTSQTVTLAGGQSLVVNFAGTY